MGWTLEDISKGIGDIGGILGKAADDWRTVTGTPTVQTSNQPAPNQPATNAAEQFQGITVGGAGLNWMVLAGIVLLLVVLLRR